MRRRGRPPYPDVLTPRQWQVLALLREGLTNEQIADRLGISLDGVKFHVSEILGKLGVRNRNEAARWHDGRADRATASLGRNAPALRRWSRERSRCPSRARGQEKAA
jgi:DNA-binding CsgD family transcriptional regulator